MNAKTALLIGIPLVALAGWFFTRGEGEEQKKIEYRYAPVVRGELARSVSATGQVVALTSVDVKSKAGGKVVRLAVDEGSVVKKGDLIAEIDPSDTQAIYEQANADLQSANARATQAARNFDLQVAQSITAVNNAKVALDAARVRLERARLQAKLQPSLSNASVRTAEATYRAALSDLEKLQQVTIPNQRLQVDTDVARSKAALDAAQADLTRQRELLEKGFVAGSAVERAQSAAAAALAESQNAVQRKQTVEQDIRTLVSNQQQAVARAKAALDEARANVAQDEISAKGVAEANQAVRQAEVALQQAIDARVQNEVRRAEVLAARASTVRSRVSVDNARVQLDSTTVLAPRDGVVTLKYLEEGTIVPPGTSTFSQGTSLVQLSDITQLFVECAVDEADVANVRVGQSVRINTEAYPGEKFSGVVDRVNPSATTVNNVTAIKVRVRVLPGVKLRILPGMNATCEFLTLSKQNVLVVPPQAIKEENGKTTVRVKTADPLKPEVREVKVGETGNDLVEILSGLKEGDEVVTAEIDVAQLKEIQKKMEEVKEGGGLAGGAPGGGRGGGGGRGR